MTPRPRPLARRGLCAALAAAALLVMSVRAGAHGNHAIQREVPLPLPVSKVAAPDAIGGTTKRLYIANDDHTDYYWSADAAAYRSAFLSMLDYYMNQAEATAGNPSDSRGRFNCDGSLWVREYEAARSPADFQRLVGHIRAGNITMPLNTAVLLYGAMPTEAVLREMYWAGRLERRESLRFPLVVPMENQALPGGVSSLWAGAGARYAWKGICDCATQIDARNRPREAYHFIGPDGRSVLMKWNSMLSNSTSIGGYAEARNPGSAVTLMDSNWSFLAEWPFPVAGSFGYGWDDLSSFTNSFVQASLDLSNANRRVIVSNEVDFFQDFEASHANDITSFSGAFGNEWDLHTASMGEVTAAMKRSVEKLRTAEALAAIATRFDPDFMLGRETARDSAFMACGLFYEHGWTADGPVSKGSRAAWHRGLQTAVAAYVDDLEADGLSRLASLITPPGAGEFHAIFNPLSWVRVDVVNLNPTIAAPRHVVDVTSGLQLPSQEVLVDGLPRLRVRVDGVPPVGYRTVEVRSGAGGSFPPAAAVTLPTIDHALYRVTLGTRGQITSLVDHKDSDRQLVESGGALNDLGAGSGTVTLRELGPVSATIGVATSSGPAHETKITLHAGIDRVDIEDVVTQNFSSEVSYNSRFNLSGSTMRHEEVGMIARVGRVSAGGDYSDQNARTDWLTLNHFIDLSQAARGVTVSNWDSPFFRAGTSTPTTLDATTPSFRAVVGMQVDGSQFGIMSQGGTSRFLNRFALRTHGPYDQAAAMRFALEHQNPLRAVRVTGGAGNELPDTNWSLIQIDVPDVLLWALKPAEEIGGGIIARVWNLAEGPRSFALSVASPGMISARRTTHIETDLGVILLSSGRLEDGLERQQMSTYRLLDPQSAVDTTPSPSVLAPRLDIRPNPVRASGSVVAFTLASPATVRVTVHDLRGARVATLSQGRADAGRREIRWGAVDDRGARLAAGVYFVRLEALGRVVTRRVVLLP